jgi:hypothetical protein
MLSQMILPKAVTKAAPAFMDSALSIDDDAINYEELTNPIIPINYPNLPLEKKSIKDFLANMLPENGGVQTIAVPTDVADQYETYNLKLFKTDAIDHRVKLLDSAYDIVSDGIVDAVIKNSENIYDEAKLRKMAKDVLIRMFFTDKDQEGNLYTKASQISNTF